MNSSVDQAMNKHASITDYPQLIKLISASESEHELLKFVDWFTAEFRNAIQHSHVAVNPAVKKALDYIDQNYMKKLTLKTVAAHVYLNKAYLGQLVSKQLNTTISDYIDDVRINKAKELLVNTNQSVAIISEMVGYSSQSYFTKVFKKRVGVAPLKYKLLFGS